MAGPRRRRELGRADRIMAGLWRLRLPLPWPGVPHVNAYAIASGSGIVLVDTGLAEPGALTELERALGQAALRLEHVRLLVCTHAHADHYGLAGPIVEAAGCELWMHPNHGHATRAAMDLDRALERRVEVARHSGVPTEALARYRSERRGRGMGIAEVVLPDRELLPGVEVETDLGRWEVHESPGHAPSHVVLHQPDRGLLLSGDHLLGRVSIYFDYGHTRDPAGEFLDSLHTVERLGARLCLAGHGRPFRDVAAKVGANRELVHSQLELVKGELGEGSRTPYELVPPLVGSVELSPMIVSWGLSQVLSYLRHLEGRGLARELPDEEPGRWELSGSAAAVAGVRSRKLGYKPRERESTEGEATMNLASFLTDSAGRHGDRTAIKLDDVEISYSALDEASARVAGLLGERGVGPGDRVGIMLPNVPYFPMAYYGVLRLGAVVVPMNPLLKGREVEFYLTDPEAKVLFAWHDFAEAAEAGSEQAGADCILVKPGEIEQLVGAAEPRREIEDRAEDDTAVILYTSGTTGKPKGAELTHSNLRRNVEVTATTLAGVSEDDVVLGALPLFHSFGQTCGLNTTVFAGGCLTLIPRFDPDKALEIIDRDRVTVFQGVPTMYSAMLASDRRGDVDVSCLRLCISGGSAMPVEVLRQFEQEFGCKVLEGYGLSETSPVASFNHPDRERKPGSIGTPIEGVEMKVVDDDGNEVAQGEVGEIAIRGHNVMKGYWNRPDATEESLQDGWFRTGDMARVDEEGYFYIVDRKKELIIRGGYNVYPREIEEVLYEHPAVAEAAVVGVPHDDLGEEVGAAVVLKQGEDVDADEVKEYCKEHLAAYKYPRRVWFPAELPKGPTGKILKREIEAPAEVRTA